MENYNIAVIGLGYVGLPLAVEFGKQFHTVGYDLNNDRIEELRNGIDITRETTKDEILSSEKLEFSSNLEKILDCNIFIIAVPTPIDENNKPNLSPLLSATSLVGSILKQNDIVIYESTVYPGCTEDDCVPLLEKKSKLKYNIDFFCGYSPERINPGDKDRSLTKIVKVTSGSNSEIAKKIDKLYKTIIKAGTFSASSIRVAEAAKIIENCQRDINIAFVNELSILFNKMNLDTKEVLEAAGTKWNFLKFQPGLVGGHCIGVDPYYLTYKAEQIGYKSKIILSGRKLNDSMPDVIIKNIKDYFNIRNKKLSNLKFLLLGVTFKENCPDTRNSRIIDVYNKLLKQKVFVDVYDPYASSKDLKKEYKINLLDSSDIKEKYYDGIIIGVGHKQFLNMEINDFCFNDDSLIYDIKGIFNNKKYMRL
ncbi:MAG: Vi polysaccharide biosynthesis protein VipA/TviB [Candidatus Marinimicrobia bacterium]|nr:Vi polysaccharide biosynthesis protein VipA/TviB [Candidatus Neomarinimicrobiota bacterium]|tara:strand:- start:1751 stop:3016 length:1266 start_codon:yes stop_codon:yes gene_type:complete